MKHSVFRCAALGTFILVVRSVAQQQQPPPDLNQLKTRFQQLQEMMQDLQKQIAAVESAQSPPGTPLVAPTANPQPTPTPQLPTEYIGNLTREREVANQDSESAARINNEEIDPSLRGYFRLPGTGTLMKFGGFVKTDVFVDTNQAGSYYGAYVPSSFPSSPQPHTVNSTVSMRPSRFFWEVRQPVLSGKDSVKAYFEFDFLSNYDRNSIRLRQYYAQYKNFLAGQTWSAFGDPDAFPDTLEFEGPPGMMATRQPAIRYTQPLSKEHSIGVSVEKSGTDTPFATQFGTPVGSSSRPDLIGFYRYENPHGHLYFAGVSRSVGGVIPNTTVPNLRNHVEGYGGSLSGVWGGKSNNVVFQVIIGKGISNYYNDNFGLGTDAGFDANGKLVATPTGTGNVGFQHLWTRSIRSTFSYGYLRINSPAGDPGTTYHISHYATGNIIVQPSPSYLFGVEYVYGSLERKDGFKWVAPRIQASVTYYLNTYRKE
jgi:hypothetical protein